MRFAVIAVVLVALAGCAQTPATPAATSSAPMVAPATPDFTDTTGAVAGVVVDESLLPASGALVRIAPIAADADLSHATDVLSDDGGRFVFSLLRPGAYQIAATHAEAGNGTIFVEVVAGKVTDARVSVTAVPSDQPYTASRTHRGFHACHFRTYPSATGNCARLTATSAERYHFYDNFTAGLNTTISEYTWKPSGAFSSNEMRASLAITKSGIMGAVYASGRSPLALTGSNFSRAIPGEHLLLNTLQLPDPTTEKPVQLVFQQGFDLHLTLFYHAAAPAGYTAIPDG